MDIQIIRDDSKTLIDHVEQYHYLHKYPDPRSLPFGYRIEINGSRYASSDGRLYGFLVIKKLQHHKQAGLFGYDDLPTAWQVLDLARVWVHPELQRKIFNGHALGVFSQAVSKLWQPVGKPDQRMSRLQADWLEHHPPVYPKLPYHIRVLISYCQLDHHDGTGYKASGFKSIGRTNDGEKEIYVRHFRQPKYVWRGVYQPELPLQMMAMAY